MPRWWPGRPNEPPYTARTMSDRPEPARRPSSGGSSRRRRGRGQGGGGKSSGPSSRKAAAPRGPATSGGGGATGSGRPAASGTASGNASGKKGTAPNGRLATPVSGPVPGRTVTVLERAPDSKDDSLAVHANRRRAAILCVAPWSVVGLVVGVLLAAAGVILVGVFAFVVITAVGSAVLWRGAPKGVARSVGARACRESEQPRVNNLVEGLCATMGLPVPEVRVVDSPLPNAMAVGRDPSSAVVVVTTGLAESLTLVQLEGVLAHELVHVKRHDAVLSAVAVYVALPWTLIKGVPTGAVAVHRFVGRGREFDADQRAAAIVRYPPGLASALESMIDRPATAASWPPGNGRVAALTRCLWIDPRAGSAPLEGIEGNLDDTRVRAAALSLR